MQVDLFGMQQLKSVLMLLVGAGLIIMSCLHDLKMTRLFSFSRRQATRLDRTVLLIAGIAVVVSGVWRLVAS